MYNTIDLLHQTISGKKFKLEEIKNKKESLLNEVLELHSEAGYLNRQIEALEVDLKSLYDKQSGCNAGNGNSQQLMSGCDKTTINA